MPSHTALHRLNFKDSAPADADGDCPSRAGPCLAGPRRPAPDPVPNARAPPQNFAVNAAESQLTAELAGAGSSCRNPAGARGTVHARV